MSHTFKKTKNSEKKKVISGQYASVHQKIARKNSGNTITAKAFLKKLDKENGTKNDERNKA